MWINLDPNISFYNKIIGVKSDAWISNGVKFCCSSFRKNNV
ncbi:hypothetical protein ACA081_00570 [Candidatus Hodgkinia cicadicola]